MQITIVVTDDDRREAHARGLSIGSAIAEFLRESHPALAGNEVHSALRPGAVHQIKTGAPQVVFQDAELANIPPPPSSPTSVDTLAAIGALPPGGAPPLDTSAIFGGVAPFTAAAGSTAIVPTASAIPPPPANVVATIAQPPGSAATAPAEPAAPASHVLNAADKDRDGFPWDTRIHGKEKTKNKDGTWRKRRGVEDATVLVVEGELRAIMGVPTPPPSGSAPVTSAEPSSAFGAFMQSLSPHLQSVTNPNGRLDQATIAALAKHVGAVDTAGNGSVGALATHPELIPALIQLVNQHLAGSVPQ